MSTTSATTATEHKETSVAEPLSIISKFDREIWEQMNFARSDPLKFADKMEELRQYYEADLFKLPNRPIRVTKEGVAALDEAIQFVRLQPALPLLGLSTGLSLACQHHVGECWAEDTIGTRGIDANSGMERAAFYGAWRGVCAENTYYGEIDAFRTVAMMIMDDGLPNRTHRVTIFGLDFRWIGIASGAHKTYGSQCVMLLCTEYWEDATKQNNMPPAIRERYQEALKKGFERDNYATTITTLEQVEADKVARARAKELSHVRDEVVKENSIRTQVAVDTVVRDNVYEDKIARANVLAENAKVAQKTGEIAKETPVVGNAACVPPPSK